MLKTLLSSSWKDYKLIDSGNEQKLERFGTYLLQRPENKALWKQKENSKWNHVDAVFTTSHEKGRWVTKKSVPKSWNIQWENLTVELQLTPFKHTGIFPEQQPLWQYMKKHIMQVTKPLRVLNLFAYTGISTLVCLAAGAFVTHIDASHDVLTWARKNAALSGLDKKEVRWIPEDAMTFLRREVKRGNTYDAVIMDPPKFGRGERGEVWKIEQLPHLFALVSQILSPHPQFILTNTYAVSLSAYVLQNLSLQYFPKGIVDHGELVIQSSTLLPMSLYSLWHRD